MPSGLEKGPLGVPAIWDLKGWMRAAELGAAVRAKATRETQRVTREAAPRQRPGAEGPPLPRTWSRARRVAKRFGLCDPFGERSILRLPAPSSLLNNTPSPLLYCDAWFVSLHSTKAK